MNVRSIYHMTLILLNNRSFWYKCQNFAIFYATFKWTSLHNVTKSVNNWWFVDFITSRDNVSLLDATSCDNCHLTLNYFKSDRIKSALIIIIKRECF